MRKLSYLIGTMLLAGLVLAQPPLRLKPFERHAAGRALTLDAPLRRRILGRSHLLIQFAAAPSDEQLKELAGRGAKVLSYVPDFALSVSADDDASFDGLNAMQIGRLRPEEKVSPVLEGALKQDGMIAALVESYSDVDPNDARAIANAEGLVVLENPDLLPNHLLVQGSSEQIRALTEWDEISYVFPASEDLLRGRPVRSCAGALTKVGPVAQTVPLVDQGWAPGGSANLKYAFVSVTEKLPADEVESEIVRAFNTWAKYVQLTFTPTSNSTDNQTIAVLFASGAHGDNYPFDGPGGVLAHTFYPVPTNPEPIAGDMHFDDSESWKIGADVDVFSIALHETGHALGLGHSDNPNDVMYPYYKMHTDLNSGDTSAILQLYAAAQNGTANPNPPAPTPAPSTPLLLTVAAPASSTTAASIALAGTTTGGSGTVQVNWSTNQGASGTAQGSSQWTIPAIPLSIGQNIITIQASDTQQHRVSENVTVTRQQVAPPTSPTPTPAPTAPTTPAPNPPTTPTPNPPATGPDATPPSLNILSPASTSLSTSASSLVINGTASDNVGVAKITWSSSTGASGTATGTSQWTTPPIALYIGTTTVIIRAYDAAGNSSWRSLTVTRTPVGT